MSVPLPACGSLFGNRVVWTEDGSSSSSSSSSSSATQWFMLQEIMCSPGASGGPWQIFLFTSSNGAQWQLLNDGAPLQSLQLHPDGMCVRLVSRRASMPVHSLAAVLSARASRGAFL